MGGGLPFTTDLAPVKYPYMSKADRNGQHKAKALGNNIVRYGARR